MVVVRRLPLAVALSLLLGIAGAVVFATAGGANAAPRGNRTQSESVAASLVGCA